MQAAEDAVAKLTAQVKAAEQQAASAAKVAEASLETAEDRQKKALQDLEKRAAQRPLKAEAGSPPATNGTLQARRRLSPRRLSPRAAPRARSLARSA